MNNLNKLKIKKVLKSQKQFLINNYHIIDIGLFGSFVKENQDESSDIDILVDFEKGHKDLFNFIRLKNFLEEIFENEVDLVMKNAIKPALKDKIYKETIYV